MVNNKELESGLKAMAEDFHLPGGGHSLIFFGKGVMAQRLDDAESKYGNNESVAHIVAFIRNKGRRAICHPGTSREGS